MVYYKERKKEDKKEETERRKKSSRENEGNNPRPNAQEKVCCGKEWCTRHERTRDGKERERD